MLGLLYNIFTKWSDANIISLVGRELPMLHVCTLELQRSRVKKLSENWSQAVPTPKQNLTSVFFFGEKITYIYNSDHSLSCIKWKKKENKQTNMKCISYFF